MLPPLDGQQLKLLFHCTVSARAASALATGPVSAGPGHLSGSDRANGTNQNLRRSPKWKVVIHHLNTTGEKKVFSSLTLGRLNDSKP